jgi:hypothetical protein
LQDEISTCRCGNVVQCAEKPRVHFLPGREPFSR